jgi:hypothetical protein
MADANTTFAAKTDGKDFTKSPLLWAGQPNILAIVRRFEGAFLITLAVQRNSNAKLNLPQPTTTAAIRVPGLATTGTDGASEGVVKLDAAVQGSVYVYRGGGGSSGGSGGGGRAGTAAAAAPVVYQLDGWHRPTHPSYWSQHGGRVNHAVGRAALLLEAELFSGHLSATAAAAMRTARAVGAEVGDFRGSRTWVDLQAAAAMQLRVAYDLVEHGGVNSLVSPSHPAVGASPAADTADDAAQQWVVRALVLTAGGGHVSANGVLLLPERVNQPAALRNTDTPDASPWPSDYQHGASEWRWHQANTSVLPGEVLVLSGSACVDLLEITLV